MERVPAPTYHLDLNSDAPWIHPLNVTNDMKLAAVQRTAGILVTAVERGRNAEYDLALRNAGMKDPVFTRLEATEENIARMEALIDAIKQRIASVTAPAGNADV